METKNEIFDQLIDFLSGNLTENEKQIIESRLLANEEWQEAYSLIKKNWEYLPNADDRLETLKHWKKFRKLHEKEKIALKPNLATVSWIAAACLLFMFISVTVFYLFKNQTFQSIHTDACYIADTLPDGGIVYLSPNTTIQYKLNPINKNLLEMSVIGEAFFVIHAKGQKKFVIDVGDTKVTVTGTIFKVKAPEKEQPVTVSVESGCVELTKKGSKQVLLVEAGEEAVYNPQNKMMNKQAKSDAIYLIYQPSAIQ